MGLEKPNLLIFLIDSQGVDNLSCYGYHRKTSPNIDKIANDGAVFLNNFSPGTWTPPSHASLMTGRYLSGHQALSLGQSRTLMPCEIPTIAETLNSVGYRTAAFSVNLLVNHEEGGILRGFKEVFYPSVLREKEKATEETLFREVGEPAYASGPNDVNVPFRRGHNDKGSLFTVYLVKNWIEKNFNGKTPFFVFINCVESHTPYWPGEPFRSRFLLDGTTEEQAKKIPQMAACPIWRSEYPWNTKTGEFGYPKSPQEWLIMQSLLDGETAQVDHRIGILSEFLQEKGIYDDTILVITSDHHDVLWEHRGKTRLDGYLEISGHDSLYDANIHIPLVIKSYPEHFPPGIHVKNMADLTDIFPTLIDLLNIEDNKVKKSVQGYSLISALNDNPKRKFILAEMWRPDAGFFIRSWSKAYRNTEYKYIWHSIGEEELYDIIKDPFEQYNLMSEKPENGILLKKEMEKFLLSLEIPPIHLKKEAIKLMVAWGYYRQIRPTD